MNLAMIMWVSFLVLRAGDLSSWKIQENYTIEFFGKKAEGTFRGLSGLIYFDPDDLVASSFDVSLSVATIDIGNQTKNKHARGSNWLLTQSFPEIRLLSSHIEHSDSGFLLHGTLTLRGVAKEIQLPFDFIPGSASTGIFEGALMLNRKDYGIEGNFMEFLVGEEFEVRIRVPVKK